MCENMSHYNEQQQERCQVCENTSQNNEQQQERCQGVSVEPFQGQQDIINGGFTSQRVGTHVLCIYPHQFDPRRNKEEIAMERLQQVHIDSVDVKITKDLFEIDGSSPRTFTVLPQSNINGK